MLAASIPPDPSTPAALKTVSVATLTTVLLKRSGALRSETAPPRSAQKRRAGVHAPLRSGKRGSRHPCFVVSTISTRAAIEAMPDGCIVVTDAMGSRDAGILGDMCARMQRRGVGAQATEGVMRDASGILGTGLSVWCDGIAVPPSVARLPFLGWQEPVACGGVTVLPDDLIVVDDDGAVVIPAAPLEQVLAEAVEQEAQEPGIMAKMKRGVPLPGLYPMNNATKARYAAFWQE